MTKNLKKNLIGLLVIVVLVAGPIAFDMYKDRQNSIVIKGPVSVYDNWEPYPKDQKEKFILTVGDAVTVKRIRYGKDYMAIRVETHDGKSGWVVPDENCLLNK